MSGSINSDLLAKDIAAILSTSSKGLVGARTLLLAGAAIACLLEQREITEAFASHKKH